MSNDETLLRAFNTFADAARAFMVVLKDKRQTEALAVAMGHKKFLRFAKCVEEFTRLAHALPDAPPGGSR